MRIQHNIMAMNAYRNYTGNTSALSKNLEKLSSGYKINRAGDDAAGLAISEKMRAQITGLKAAQKNAKDGISLVQTAEGALTEVHSMLNRMVDLADQSANGTFDDTTDRANLQKEVAQLKSEIDRIADATNFNGIKLLDGSLSSSGKAGSTSGIEADLSKLGLDISLSATDVAAVKGVYTTNDLTQLTAAADGDKYTFTMNFTDANGKEQSITKTLIFKEDSAGDVKDIYLDDGSKDGVKLTAGLAADGTVADGEIGAALKEVLEKDDIFKQNFTMTNTTDTLAFTARAGGTGGAVVKSVQASSLTATAAAAGTAPTAYATKVDTTTKAVDAYKAYDMTKAKVWGSTNATNGTDNLSDAIFEINGKKFAFVQSAALDTDQLAELNKAGVTHWINVAADTGVAGADIAKMVEKIQKETGLEVKQGGVAGGAFTPSNTGSYLSIKSSTSTTAPGKAGGLTLQIGDTSDDYNQLTVSVGDMHTKNLGIDVVDISDQEGGKAAAAVLKAAIDSVSSTRGDLGATQNRLEHTINNLSVMTENIQDAEANIRDVDVAEEMMAYTKNNILVQSAQAMLAQANQLPQGVLQLLQ